MTTGQERLIDYLGHVLEAIDRIGRYTSGMDRSAFLSNALVQDAVIRNLEIIGEACHNIARSYPDFASCHPDLPLGPAYQMRNAVAHGYFKVDMNVVWNTIAADLPGLRVTTQAALGSLPAV